MTSTNRSPDYQDNLIGNRNQILCFPNGFHNTTVYWVKQVW